MVKCKTQNNRRSLCQNLTRPVSIGQYFLSLQETNDGKNEMTGFSENKSNPLLNGGLLPAVLPW